MLSIIRNAAARATCRRVAAANVRTMTTETGAQASSLPSVAEAGVLSTMSPPAPSVAGPSSLMRSAAPSVIRIPPAEDPLLHLFTSLVMKHGKRHEASRVISKMLLHIHAFTKAPPLPIVRQAVEYAAPLLRCRSFKRAAKQYVFPMPLTERQRMRQAIMWIQEASERKGGRHLPERLAREIIAVVKGDSEALKRKSDVHKLAVLHRGNVVRPPRVPKSNRG
ncbi:ribosomal protein S7 domain-containing protein [Earliella scabrosa]|nr:ribosomal protein S7 domain-containing protein [Earliella scabrosa]